SLNVKTFERLVSITFMMDDRLSELLGEWGGPDPHDQRPKIRHQSAMKLIRASWQRESRFNSLIELLELNPKCVKEYQEDCQKFDQWSIIDSVMCDAMACPSSNTLFILIISRYLDDLQKVPRGVKSTFISYFSRVETLHISHNRMGPVNLGDCIAFIGNSEKISGKDILINMMNSGLLSVDEVYRELDDRDSKFIEYLRWHSYGHYSRIMYLRQQERNSNIISISVKIGTIGILI